MEGEEVEEEVVSCSGEQLVSSAMWQCGCPDYQLTAANERMRVRRLTTTLTASKDFMDFNRDLCFCFLRSFCRRSSSMRTILGKGRSSSTISDDVAVSLSHSRAARIPLLINEVNATPRIVDIDNP